MYPGVANYRRLVKRVYNPDSGEHFYTKNKAEKDHLVSVGWQDEGIAWYASVDLTSGLEEVL
ncbi:MAG: hypothetical protein LKH11_10300 [Solobacterium sp.]|jgi:hypothetical protein|nr:hypothetical protein [Solobacterium sp.]MCI1347207.1 hypothetical protein [Solobacterium sp.]MCI1408607.1 hypothetical protein [Solobacterium sp.]MCI1436777.1 hypothetical protein [Solobacterium sp.]